MMKHVHYLHSCITLLGVMLTALATWVDSQHTSSVHGFAWISQVTSLLVISAITDIRLHRIANHLTYTSVLGGLVMAMLNTSDASWWSIAPPSLSQSMLGATTCALLMLTFWTLRAVGGGDVKLVFALGILLGAQAALTSVLVAHVLAAAWMLGVAFCVTFMPALGMLSRVSVLPADGTVTRRTRIPMGGFYAGGVMIIWASILLNHFV